MNYWTRLVKHGLCFWHCLCQGLSFVLEVMGKQGNAMPCANTPLGAQCLRHHGGSEALDPLDVQQQLLLLTLDLCSSLAGWLSPLLFQFGYGWMTLQ